LQYPYPIKKQGRIKRRIKGNKIQDMDIVIIYIYVYIFIKKNIYIIMDTLLADLEVSGLTGVYSINQDALITANRIAKRAREDANKLFKISMKCADEQRQEEKVQEAEADAQKAKEAAWLEAARQIAQRANPNYAGGKYK